MSATSLQPHLNVSTFLSPNERYITHLEMKEDGKSFFLVITNESFYKVRDITSRGDQPFLILLVGRL
jgi:hypothetical protein